MQSFGTQKSGKIRTNKSCNLLGHKKKITQPLRGKKSCNLLGPQKNQAIPLDLKNPATSEGKKSCNLWDKKIMLLLGTKKNHATSQNKKKSHIGTKKNHATSRDKKKSHAISRDKKIIHSLLKFLSGHFEFVTVYLGLVFTYDQ